MARRELLSENSQTKMKKRKNARLTLNQSFEVTTYLECQRERIIGKMTIDEVMAELEKKFPDWPIAVGSVKATLRVRNIKPKPPSRVYAPSTPSEGDGKVREGRPGGDYYRLAKEAKAQADEVAGRVGKLEGLVDTVATLSTNSALQTEVLSKVNQRLNEHFAALAKDDLRLKELEKQMAELRSSLGLK